MKLKSLLEKFRPAAVNENQLFAVIQPDAIYFSAGSSSAASAIIPIEGSNWEGAFEKALKQVELSDAPLNVVLNANHYQTYQIEKPELPKEEWPVALPFLLKELITERVTDIVTDAIALPTGNKVQAYVLSKKLLDRLLALINAAGGTLNAVLPEDELWGHSAGELENFMLLQRSKKGNFKIGAFVNQTVCFQRTIRSVAPPLTGAASSSLQLDGLALELQRSIDYLSSQLKGTQLHQLKVCCDDEDEEELARELNDRLSAKVSRLIEGEQELSGQIIERIATQLKGFSVNLYPTHLKPKKEYFSLANVVGTWCVISAIMLGTYGYYRYEISTLEVELAQQQQQAAQLNQQTTELKKKLERHVPTPEKIAAINRLKAEISAKQSSLSAVGEYDQSQQVGYSGVMSALATLGRRDISLSHITINANTLDLKGVARNASVVPNWISQFKHELNLVGRTFDKLKIGRNEQDIVTFELHTRGGTK